MNLQCMNFPFPSTTFHSNIQSQNFRSGPITKFISLQNTESQAALISASTWKYSASCLICEATQGETACSPCQSVPRSSARLRAQVIGILKWGGGALPPQRIAIVIACLRTILIGKSHSVGNKPLHRSSLTLNHSINYPSSQNQKKQPTNEKIHY